MPRPRTPVPPRECENCRAPVSNSGRRSADGLYYCVRRECQAAKAKRRYRDSARFDSRPWAPEFCSNPKCARKLSPRRIRVGETMLGRWCDNPACRRHRNSMLKAGSAVPQLQQDLEDMTKSRLFLHHAIFFERVTCPVCGVEDAVDGFIHPDGYGDRCTGTGEGYIHKGDVYPVWPDRGIPIPGTVVPHAD